MDGAVNCDDGRVALDSQSITLRRWRCRACRSAQSDLHEEPDPRRRAQGITVQGVCVSPAIADGVILLDGHRLSDVASIVAGEDEELARWFGWWPARSTWQDGRTAVERWQHQWRTGGSVRSFAVREAATSVLVGGCEIRLGEHENAAMSYWVFPHHRRRGFASRAVRLASDFALAELGVKRLELHIAADNLASRGVARRIGFGESAGPARCGPILDGEVLYSRA